MLRIDGSQGEGGGQILRSSLTLALATGTPVRIENVRASRSRPGLRRQHLTAVRAAAEISSAEVAGDELGSPTVELRPGRMRPGDYRFEVGSAGSATLVLQTILLPLALADGSSTVLIEGGTHNPWSPPYEFLVESFLPLLARMGVTVEARLLRPGFHPAGGGLLSVSIEPCRERNGLELVERGNERAREGCILIANLPDRIARTERACLVEALGWEETAFTVRRLDDSAGPGNAILLRLVHDEVTVLFTAFGRRGVPAARVAGEGAEQVRRYRRGTAPVETRLADQLLLPLALLGGGRFRTFDLSKHTRTNLQVLGSFELGESRARELGSEDWLIEID